jgi:hypothetical protein
MPNVFHHRQSENKDNYHLKLPTIKDQIPMGQQHQLTGRFSSYLTTRPALLHYAELPEVPLTVIELHYIEPQ